MSRWGGSRGGGWKNKPRLDPQLGFRQCTRGLPCPVCGKPHWCSIREDGRVVNCRFEGSPIDLKHDKDGVEYYRHIIRGDVKEIPLPGVHGGAKHELAPLDNVNTINEALWDLLPLYDHHKEELYEARGLTPEEVREEELCSWPATQVEADEIIEKLERLLDYEDQALLPGVPGFYEDDDGAIRLLPMKGWVIPCRDIERRLIAFRFRFDKPPGEMKYIWISSSKRRGPGAISCARLAPTSLLYRPRDSWPEFPLVTITEGEIKSIYLRRHLQAPSISIPGVGQWRHAMPWLKHLLPNGGTVGVAFDRDIETNKHVFGAYRALREALIDEGYTFQKIAWE